MYCRYFHALQLKLVEAAKENAHGDDTDDGDCCDRREAGDQNCEISDADDESGDACNEESPATSPEAGYGYLGHLVTIQATWFNVAWAKQTHGEDYAMAW